jgi:hypothetical protein
MWAVNLGLLGFAFGLAFDSAVLKRVSTPIMGLGLLIGIAMYIRDPLKSDPALALN